MEVERERIRDIAVAVRMRNSADFLDQNWEEIERGTEAELGLLSSIIFDGEAVKGVGARKG